MRKRLRNALLLQVLIAMILLIPTGCSSDATDILNVDNEGNTSIDKEALENTINQDPAQELDGVEEEGILYMREEEKLARDVYSKLYEI